MALHNLITILSVSVQSLCYNTPPLGQFFSNSYITSCLGVTYSCLVLGYKDFIGDFDISSVSATRAPCSLSSGTFSSSESRSVCPKSAEVAIPSSLTSMHHRLYLWLQSSFAQPIWVTVWGYGVCCHTSTSKGILWDIYTLKTGELE